MTIGNKKECYGLHKSFRDWTLLILSMEEVCLSKKIPIKKHFWDTLYKNNHWLHSMKYNIFMSVINYRDLWIDFLYHPWQSIPRPLYQLTIQTWAHLSNSQKYNLHFLHIGSLITSSFCQPITISIADIV